MPAKLELVREEKLFRLLPGTRKRSRLEASGVTVRDDATALVVFDNINCIATIDLSLRRRNHNRLVAAPSLGLGFEDIAIDYRHGRVFCLIESLQDFDGHYRSSVGEYDRERFVRCTQLDTRFATANKGFEGIAHVWLRGREHLLALCEASGRIDVFVRAPDGGWKPSCRIGVPKDLDFKDYSALAYHDKRLAIVSQASARVWIATVDEKGPSIVPESSATYRFPSRSYGNVEGIAWVSPDTLVAVSDRKKKHQPDRCAKKDQSIHLFRIPNGA
jgi:hypothetical protein